MSEESQVWANQVGAPMRLADGTVLTPGPQGYAVHNGKLYYPRNDGRGGYYVTNEGAAIGDPFQVYNADGSFSNNGVLTKAKFSDLAAMAALSAVGMGAFLPAMGAGGAAGGAAGAAGAGAGAGMTGAAFGDAGLMYAGADAAAAGALGGGASLGAGAASAAAAGGGSSFLAGLTGGGGWTSLIGPAASIGGALINAGAAGDAADRQSAATREANAILERQGAQIRADLEPYRRTGVLANNRLAELLGLQNPGAEGYGSLMKEFTGADVESEPGYVFARDQGQKALDNKFAAAGSYFSGAALKGAAKFNSDYAGTRYDAAFQRDAAQKNQRYNFLAGGVSTGANAAAQTGNAGMQVASGVAGNTTNLGNAMGAAAIAKSNALAGGVTGAWDAYQQDQMLKSFQQRNALQRAVTSGNAGWGSAWTNGMRTSGMDGYDSLYG